MSKSFKEKREREDNDMNKKQGKNISKKIRRSEKQISNALRSRDVNTLIRYSEELE